MGPHEERRLRDVPERTARPPVHDGGDFAVVGNPIGHSLSPVLHRAAYAALGVTDAGYSSHEVAAGDLVGFLGTGTGRALRGLSVTMPLKREAFDLAAEHDATSEALGVSNTLVRRPDGTWRAENHDVHGIAQSLRDHGVVTAPVSAAVLGSGATALSAMAALIELGAGEILLSARTEAKLAPLAEFAEARGTAVRIVAWERAVQALEAEVVVSALASAGAEALADRLRGTAGLPVPAHVLDVLYDPWPAPLADLLGERGSDVASGLEMLVHQAARQVSSMLRIGEVPTSPMLEAGLAALALRR